MYVTKGAKGTILLVLILYIHISYVHGHNTLPLHGKTPSAIDEQTENGPKKTPPTTLSRKKDQR
jgi:hypothetical protein